MSTENAKDYLGHPCQTTEAYEAYQGYMKEFRQDADKDQRATARQMGIRILGMQKRIDHLYNLLSAMEDLVSEHDSGSDALCALIEIGLEYAVTTSNRYCDLAGLSLVALEQGGLWKPQAKEVQHG